MIDIIKIKFAEINSLTNEILLKQDKIKFLENLVKNKENNNEALFTNILKDLSQKESDVQKLLGNKIYKNIKYVDFLSKDELIENNGLDIFEKAGMLLSETTARNEILILNKKISGDRKQIEFTFSSDDFSNEIEFSFYNKINLPLSPKSVIFIMEEESEELNEPSYRYYNRNEIDTFVNNFYFYPRKIQKILINFEDEINTNNYVFKLLKNNFNTNENSFAKVKVDLDKNIRNVNIFINSEDDFVPIKYLYSTNNLEYEELKLDGKKGNVDVNKSQTLFLQFKPDYKNIKQKDKKQLLSATEESIKIKQSPILYPLNNQLKIKLNKIIFSSLNRKNLFEKMEYYKVDITNFIEEIEGIYSLKPEFIVEIKETTKVQQNLLYEDDISILKTKPEKMNFYFNTITNEIMTPAFLDDFDFFIDYLYEENVEYLDPSLISPYIFDISIKY
ncbi:hypothetical protein [Cetobacterium sp.]|uniref:hypothetical protein n=1 Tax=Cetobacterium sp. TaxID=2071632 RepID=UPI003F2EC7DE